MTRRVPKHNGKTETIYEGYVVTLRREGIDMPDGRTVDFEVVRHAPATAVLAIDDEDRVIFVHQFRPALGQPIWELPAGIMEEGEEPLPCAQRELREETGFSAEEWIPLGDMYTAPGFCDEVIHLFLARGLSAGSQDLDHNEYLEPHAIPLDEVHRMVDSGEIGDGKSIVALYRAAAHLGRGQGPGGGGRGR